MRTHLGMPPMETVRGEKWACYQLMDSRRAVGAVLFAAWSADDIRVQSLRFETGVTDSARKAFVADAQKRLAKLLA